MFLRFFSGLAYGSESWRKWSGEWGGRSGKELDERSMAWVVRCCLGSLRTSCSDVCKIFFRTRYGSESWKKWSGRVGGRSAEGVDEKSVAWGGEVLLGVIRDKLQ